MSVTLIPYTAIFNVNGNVTAEQLLMRKHVLAWVQDERARYADEQKFKEGAPGRDIIREPLKNGEWDRALDFIGRYTKRAELLGLDTESGRQALGKAITSALHILETACEYHGQMPDPGQSSGEVQPWLSCPYPLPGQVE